MKRRIFIALLAFVPPAAALAQGTAPADPTGPQPELPKEKLVIIGKDGTSHSFDVEVASTPDQQTIGEMFRTAIPADGGMLFDWGFPRESQMWMRNTLVPLDMVFINADGTIRSIAENTIPRSLAIIDSRGPVRATLELQGGITAKLDISVGDTVHAKIFGNVA